MASLKQITVGTTSYDIIPDAITDSNANYKASCPTISSNTTVEVTSNKTTVINSSSTDTKYPSAKAVFTAIQNASKAGTFASNIGTTDGSACVPLVSTGGMFGTTYLQNLGIPENKRMSVISGGSNTTIDYMATAGTISSLALQNATGGTAGKITKFGMDSSTTIGDSTAPTADNTALGQNGLYGSGNVYIAATGSSDPLNSNYAFKGTIINKAGVSSTVKGGLITSIINGSYATIGTLRNGSNGEISNIESYGTFGQFLGLGTSKISRIYLDTNATIGDSTAPTADNTALGQNGLYGSGNVYIAATGSSTPHSDDYAFTGSIINKAGISSSVQGGYLKTISNGAYATINKLINTKNGRITTIENSGDIEQMHNTGFIELYADSGSATAIIEQESTADVIIRTSLASPDWHVAVNGKISPWQEAPNIDSLIAFLNLQTGILYKYTGSTTTYNGIQYINNNFYRYEA